MPNLLSPEEHQEKLKHLQEHKKRLLGMIDMYKEAEDWHGIADAAMDLREIDREIKIRKELQN